MPAKLPLRNVWLPRIALGLAAMAATIALGPRNRFGTHKPAPRAAPPEHPGELDDWLATQESAIPGVRPDAAKGIVWATAEKKPTPVSIVYLHGFSATRQEMAPMPDRIADALGANLYYARLSGHGVPRDAMGQVTVQEWLADATEALTIGRILGEKVVVIGCSTGATLATWLGLQEAGKAIAALVFISPNFGPFDSKAEVVNWPWGRQLVRSVQGSYRKKPSATQAERDHWTTCYPTKAIFPMMALVKEVRNADLGQLKMPTLMLYSEGDQIISPKRVRESFARFGSPTKTLESVRYSTSANQHVLAGAIKSPEATEPMAKFITDWLQALPAKSFFSPFNQEPLS
ncbi:MAG: alpha/beta fold hydrolase [Rhodocyclaceae bacterium]|jgi:esterase/lipase|nr:alpha/beta fold hydrolase [Rhodocyclaceae bacterium]MBK6907812.1 alpha/beta fold hydrolase [Rhodocyclaceae bacterium]